jgi:hypothetical protein
MQLNFFVGQAGGRSCYHREHLPLQAVERAFVQLSAAAMLVRLCCWAGAIWRNSGRSGAGQ